MTTISTDDTANDRCCVLGCSKTIEDNVKLHEFPFDDDALLPVWIMATNRSRWTPTRNSRMCDRHFSNDNYCGGDKNNNLVSNACPIICSSDVGCANTMAQTVADSDVSSTSDVRPSEISFYGTPHTTDMNFSDFYSDLSDSDEDCNETNRLNEDDDCLFSSSENECEDTTPAVNTYTTAPRLNPLTNSRANSQECAVLLCTENFRKHFRNLYFICFPTNNLPLCNTWWGLCGRTGEFDPSSKICSIHFNDAQDFKSVTEKRNNRVYIQTLLRTFNTVPSLFLLPHQFAMVSNRKRKKSITDEKSASKMYERCSIQNCSKTNYQNSRNTLFFRFPLENKVLLEQWLDSIEISHWQPTENDRICSDHFEDCDVIKVSDDCYNLDTFACPFIKPEKPFVLNSKDLNRLSVKVQPQLNNRKSDRVGDDSLSICNNNNYSRNVDNSVLTNNANKNSQLQNEAATTILNATKKDSNEEKEGENKNLNKNIFIVCMDELNDEQRMVKVQPIIAAVSNLKNELDKQKMMKFPQIRIISCEKNPSVVHINSNSIMMETLPTSTTSTVSPKLPKTTGTRNEVNSMEPESINNEYDQDNGNLECFNGNDVGEYLKNNSREKIPVPIESSTPKGIPKSILSCKELTECYGEMHLPMCELGCQNYCFHAVPGPQRAYIFKEFHMLNDATKQNCTIAQLIKLRTIRKGNNTSLESYPFFHLIVNDRSVKVCRLFFCNTLGITDGRLNAILNPINYSWYSNIENALKANQPNHIQVISEPMTDFVKESLKPLNKDYNLYEPERDMEVSLNNVPAEEYRKVILYMKSIPRVLTLATKHPKKRLFETTINVDYMYKTYSEDYIIQYKVPPPYTKRQFKKIYNDYMKPFLEMV